MQHGVVAPGLAHPGVRVGSPTRSNGWVGDGRAILCDVRVTDVLDSLIDVLSAPTPEGATPRLSAALERVVVHRAAAVLAGACARSPMTVAGEPELAERITTADLARLAALVGVGEAWQGEAAIAGASRPVLAPAAASAGTGSLLVLILRDAAPAGDDVVALVTRVWELVAGRMG